MSDFTDYEVFRSYLSSFWTQVVNSSVASGISHANSIQLQQLYQEFVESVSRVSISTIKPFHKELSYALVLRRADFSTDIDSLRFGDGTSYGSQPAATQFKEGTTFLYQGLEKGSGLYYLNVPSELKNVGSVILNRLFEPSVVLVKDVDFQIINDSIAFSKDPFENPMIPKRTVAGSDGSIDQEIVLWAMDASFDRQEIYQQFGFAFSRNKVSSEGYRRSLEIIMKTLSMGPSVDMIDSFVAAISGAPITKEVTEIIQKIDSFDGRALVITNSNVYQIPSGMTLRSSIIEGASLRAGQPLTTATEVFDNGDWWSSVSGMTLSGDMTSLDLGDLGFLNQAVKVNLSDEAESQLGNSGRNCDFFLTGSKQDIQKFWTAVKERSLESGIFLGNQLWKDSGFVHQDGTPDFSKELYINPLEFLASKVLGDSLIAVKIDLTSVNAAGVMFQNIKMLKELIPAWLGIVVFLNVSFDESYDMEGDVTIIQAVPVSTTDLVNGNIDSFDSSTKSYFNSIRSDGKPLTKIPEALSIDINPDIITEIIDIGNPDSYGTGNPAIAEEILAKNEPICN